MEFLARSEILFLTSRRWMWNLAHKPIERKESMKSVPSFSSSCLWMKSSHLQLWKQLSGSKELTAIFAMELAFSHSLFLRLFLGFILLHAIYLFISTSTALVLGINSFSHERVTRFLWFGKLSLPFLKSSLYEIHLSHGMRAMELWFL